MKIGHISDIHWLDTTGVRVSDFFNKRLSGGLNLLAGRAQLHSKDVTRCALQSLKDLGCDHLIITGDLTNLALPAEFEAVKTELTQVFSLNQISIVPGNHDFYTYESAKDRRFERILYNISPGNLDLGLTRSWPFVRTLGDVAIIGLNSAVPRPWFVAAGMLDAQQLKALAQVLERDGVQSRFKIVALHHHLTRVVRAPGEFLRNLKGGTQLLEICRRAHVDMIVHGHNHDYTLCRVDHMVISEAGSCSVCRFKQDERAGKFNLYTIEGANLVQIQTYRYAKDHFELWKTWHSSDIPQMWQATSPLKL